MNQQTEARSPQGGDSDGRPARQDNTRFFLIVIGLMIMIIALLAGLWLRERVRASTAEYEVRLITNQHRMLDKLIKQMILVKQTPTTHGAATAATQMHQTPGTRAQEPED